MAGRLPRRAMLAVLAVSIGVIVGCSRDEAATPAGDTTPASAELQVAQSSYPVGALPQLTMVLGNNGSGTCALPSIADGSIEVVSVTRDGTAVIGRPGREDHFNGIAAVVADGLRSVAPGASIAVPLDVKISAAGTPVVKTSVQTPDDNGQTTSWLLDQPGNYKITARMATVSGVARTDLPEHCATAGAPVTAEFEVTA
jgi:hypothetical protein